MLPTPGGGGAQRAMINLARGFVEAGVRTDFLVASGADRLRSAVPSGVRVVDVGGGRVSLAVPGTVRYLREQRPEMHVSAMPHTSLAASLARVVARSRTRIVAVEHNALSEISSRGLRRDR